jgi:hypothetical protein
MKTISDFARKPELVKIVLDTEDIKAEFGDEVVFYMKDFVDINTYFDFYRSQSENNGELSILLQKIILTETGEPMLDAGDALPVNLAVAALTRINETLGKLKTKPLMNETGNQQS